MKIEIDVPDGLIEEIDRLSIGVFHSREEYILDKVRDGIMQDEKNTWFKEMAKKQRDKYEKSDEPP
jgi:metal-responsive CopG/Arc/MetJ family transcriptional regulator